MRTCFESIDYEYGDLSYFAGMAKTNAAKKEGEDLEKLE